MQILKWVPWAILFLLTFLLIFLLSGDGGKKGDYHYLMLHPEYLQRVYNQCVQEIVDEKLPCETIIKAQVDFTELVGQRAKDPEGFGIHILQEQENKHFLKTKLDTTWQAYLQLGASKPSVEDLMKLRMQVDQAQVEYQISDEKVKTMLAVVAVTSYF